MSPDPPSPNLLPLYDHHHPQHQHHPAVTEHQRRLTTRNCYGIPQSSSLTSGLGTDFSPRGGDSVFSVNHDDTGGRSSGAAFPFSSASWPEGASLSSSSSVGSQPFPPPTAATRYGIDTRYGAGEVFFAFGDGGRGCFLDSEQSAPEISHYWAHHHLVYWFRPGRCVCVCTHYWLVPGGYEEGKFLSWFCICVFFSSLFLVQRPSVIWSIAVVDVVVLAISGWSSARHNRGSQHGHGHGGAYDAVHPQFFPAIGEWICFLPALFHCFFHLFLRIGTLLIGINSAEISNLKFFIEKVNFKRRKIYSMKNEKF